MRRIAPEWNHILLQCGVKPHTAAIWSEVFAAVVRDDTFRSEADARAFLGQILHESAMLERLEENLNYSAERLTKVWPKRFPSIAEAKPYERNPEALANKVYGGRLGNIMDGDGWRYRGRGCIMVTGRANYTALAKLSGLDLAVNPDLLRQPLPALQASIAWWLRNVPSIAIGDVAAVTRIVNGGTHGLDDRVALTDKAARAMEA